MNKAAVQAISDGIMTGFGFTPEEAPPALPAPVPEVIQPKHPKGVFISHDPKTLKFDAVFEGKKYSARCRRRMVAMLLKKGAHPVIFDPQIKDNK